MIYGNSSLISESSNLEAIQEISKNFVLSDKSSVEKYIKRKQSNIACIKL